MTTTRTVYEAQARRIGIYELHTHLDGYTTHRYEPNQCRKHASSSSSAAEGPLDLCGREALQEEAATETPVVAKRPASSTAEQLAGPTKRAAASSAEFVAAYDDSSTGNTMASVSAEAVEGMGGLGGGAAAANTGAAVLTGTGNYCVHCDCVHTHDDAVTGDVVALLDAGGANSAPAHAAGNAAKNASLDWDPVGRAVEDTGGGDTADEAGKAGEPHFIEIRVRGNGFLKRMVRRIVGTLVLVGLGKREPSYMGDIVR